MDLFYNIYLDDTAKVGNNHLKIIVSIKKYIKNTHILRIFNFHKKKKQLKVIYTLR